MSRFTIGARLARVAERLGLPTPLLAQFVGVILGILVVFTVCAAPPAPTPSVPKFDPAEARAYVEAAQKKLGATFRALQIDKVEPSEIAGIVAVYAGPQILYYAPKEDVLILGEFYTPSGQSLTQERIAKYAGQKSDEIDRSVALTLGQGAREVIVFVDPDCGYCRKAEEWLRAQNFKDVRQQVFFMPLKGRPSAEARALRALCAGDVARAEAFLKVFEKGGGADSAERLFGDSAGCPGGQARLNAHGEIARKVGVYATPFFLVDGVVVAGFDPQRLTELLGSQRLSQTN
jgi:thiol:disulfide interchange protein DsbC